MHILASSCPGLLELNLEAEIGPDPNASSRERLSPTLVLESLTLTGLAIPTQRFATFLCRATRLQSLSLTTCTMSDPMRMPPLPVSLQNLGCRDCRAEPGHDFWDVAAWCPGLTSLVTAYCRRRMLARSLADCSKLVQLEIGGRNYEDYREWPTLNTLICWNVMREDLRMLAEVCSGLQEVSFRNRQDRHLYFSSLLSSCTQLRTIRVNDVYGAVSRTQSMRGEYHVRLESVDGAWELCEEGEWRRYDDMHKYRVHSSLPI
eukprot:SM000095S24948  [mRNA]  locus=s95:34498:35320:+ [translate_table: standard]